MGTWEQGSTCEVVTCSPYKPPSHGSVDKKGWVRAGDSVKITCDAGYEPFGLLDGLSGTPLCRDDGEEAQNLLSRRLKESRGQFLVDCFRTSRLFLLCGGCQMGRGGGSS